MPFLVRLLLLQLAARREAMDGRWEPISKRPEGFNGTPRVFSHSVAVRHCAWSWFTLRVKRQHAWQVVVMCPLPKHSKHLGVCLILDHCSAISLALFKEGHDKDLLLTKLLKEEWGNFKAGAWNRFPLHSGNKRTEIRVPTSPLSHDPLLKERGSACLGAF